MRGVLYRIPTPLFRLLGALLIWIVGFIIQLTGFILGLLQLMSHAWKKFRGETLELSFPYYKLLLSFPTLSLGWDALMGRFGLAVHQPSDGILIEWGIDLKKMEIKKGGDDMRNEERRKILDMLAQGKITPEEAERLLEALEASSETTKPPKRGKTLLIDVHDLEDNEHVVVRIPLSLARWALKAGIGFGSLTSSQIKDPEKRKQVEEALRSLSDVDTDSLMEELSHLDELVRVDSDEAKVIIRVE